MQILWRRVLDGNRIRTPQPQDNKAMHRSRQKLRGRLVRRMVVPPIVSDPNFTTSIFSHASVNAGVILLRLYRIGFADGSFLRDAKHTNSHLILCGLVLLHSRTRADMHLTRFVKLVRELKPIPRSLRRHAETRADMRKRAPTCRYRVCIYFGGRQ